MIISHKQNKWLRGLAAKAGHDDAEFHNTLYDVTGKRSMKLITQDDFQDMLAAYGVVTKSSKPVTGRVPRKKYAASREGMVEEIEDIAKELWKDEWKDTLHAWLNAKRKGGKAGPEAHCRFLSFTALKALKKRFIEMIESLSH